MKSDDHDNQGQGSETTSSDHEEGGSREDHADVVSTTDPAVASGRGQEAGRNLRPDETIVTETSRVTRAVPSYVPDANAFVEPEREGGRKSENSEGKREDGAKGKAEGQGQNKAQAHDEADDSTKHGDQDRRDAGESPSHSVRSGWMSYVMTALVALVFGVGGAWAFSYFDKGKDKDQAQQGGKSQAKKGGDSSSTKNDSSQGHAKGQSSGGGSSNDSGSEIPGFTSAEDADTLKKQIGHLSSRFDTLQQRVEALSVPRNVVAPDISTLQIKMGELSKSVDEISSLPSRSRQMESRIEHLQEEIKGLRDQLSAAKDRGTLAADTPSITAVDRRVDSIVPPPAPTTSVLPSDPNSPDEAMSVGIALFKKGQYPQADDIFGKLQLTRPQDARVWYYSALAHGFTTGKWDGDTKHLVEQGADRERAGMPSTSQIDAAFAGLSTIQGKDWLSAYRAQLVKR